MLSDMTKNVLVHPLRDLNYRFMVAEWLWIVGGLDELKYLINYNKNMRNYSDDGLSLSGAYGPRLLPQWQWLIDKLRQDSDSRQAVAVIWTPIPFHSKDIPCTLTLQFIVREQRVNLIVTMRSSDIWLGLPHDMFVFSQIGIMVASRLDLDPGFIQFNLGSSHMYESNFLAADELLSHAENAYTVQSPVDHEFWPSPELCIDLLERRAHHKVYTERPWGLYAQVLQSPNREAALKVLGG